MSFVRHSVYSKVSLLTGLITFVLLLWLLRGSRYPVSWYQHKSSAPAPALPIDDTETEIDFNCRNLAGADDVVVVLKTGATELLDKLPVHLDTTLRCYPHHLIFSDYEEVFRDEVILDALESVNPLVKAEHPDFSLWRRLQENGGRSALQRSELSGPISKPEGGGGKSENPGWKLDKWKFLPMMNRTLYEYPDKKWFVFVETDTYVIWQTLLQYLSNLDWTKQYYLGGQINIGDIEFAQGGNGFAASRPAMEKLSQMFAFNQDYWEDFVDNHWAGDCVLGKAFKDSGTPLLHAWPIFQGDPIGDMNYDKEDSDHRLWCGPTVSYHHIPPSIIKDMWHFEQKWIAETQKDASKFVRHLDMYAEYVLPRTTEPRRDWDNHSKTDQGPVDSLAACHEICLGTRSCLQYSLSYDMRCLTTERPNVGEPSRGIESGWIHDRMRDFFSDADRCSRGEGWIT